MSVKLLTNRHLEFLSLKGGCTGLSESTLVKMSNCCKSHAVAQIILLQESCHYVLIGDKIINGDKVIIKLLLCILFYLTVLQTTSIYNKQIIKIIFYLFE